MSKLDVTKIVEKLPDNELPWHLKFINVESAWKKTKGKGVRILLLDTGLETSHEEFAETFGIGYNFFERSFDAKDNQGHGTHVGGLLTGFSTGVAPEAQLDVMKVLTDNGSGSFESVYDGITFAINTNYDIVCMSLGVNFPNESVAMNQNFQRAYDNGIIMVCATGNDSMNEALFPASLDTVIGVGGLDTNGNVADFSNSGYDVLAPAEDVYSTYLEGNYALKTGTSMASPLVAGAIALMISDMKSKGESYTIESIRQKLMSLENNVLDLSKLLQ